MRRVVVTGMGMVSPLGLGAEACFRQLLEGRSGVRQITRFETADLPARIAGEVPRGTGPGEFNPLDFASAKDVRHLEEFVLFALGAAHQAVTDAEWLPTGEHALERTGVLIGSGIGGIESIANSAVTLHEKGPRRVSPYFIPSSLINEVSGAVSMKYGFRGPNHSVVTACATGAHAIGDAARLIAYGDADVMIAGGTEAATCRLTIAGFSQMRALSTGYNNDPTAASRPWDKARDGFVLGEGAGVLVLEERDHALQRGARIYAEILGYGLSGDAYHVSAPEPTGDGARRAMKAALDRAKLDPSAIDYVNAHATSTPVGDPVELNAVRDLFQEHSRKLCMSATKSATGHLLGAAGAVESVFTILALRDGVVPPTLNLHEPSPATSLDLVPLKPKERAIHYALSNSFGFGGTNAALVFGRGE
jgi:3-oxoacyl-[acyl-carrier-protein] synthase II